MSENLNKLQQRQLLAYAKDLAEIYEKEKEKRKKLEIANKKLLATINGISSGIVTIDESLIIIEANEAFLKIIDNPSETIEGKHIQSYLLKSNWNKLYHGIEQLSEPDEILINPDNKRFRFYKIIRSPIFNNKKKLMGVVFSFIDETQKKKNDMLKDEFLALISHEIRTPLTAIMGLTPFLEESLAQHLTAEDREFFAMIQDSSHRLIRTVTELKDAAELSTEFLSEPKVFNLHDALKEAINITGLLTNNSSKRIKYLKGNFDPFVYGYNDLVIKAISHLLENALEFSAENSTITIKTYLSEHNYQIVIQDQGIGIPVQELEVVFDKFYQVEDHMTRKHEGLGLGLSIVKKVALLHHGKIELESKPRIGTKAIFSLPEYEEKKAFKNVNDSDELNEQILYLKQQSRKYAEELVETYTTTKELSLKLHKSEQHIIRAEKLATMGQIAAGIAHEVNNMLTPIIGHAQLLMLNKDELDPKILHGLQIINDRGFKAANMLRQILNFTHKGSEIFERIDIVNLINKTVTLLGFRFRKSKVELSSQFAQKHIDVFGNSGQLEQVFTNFIGNALDAMPKGGHLSIKVDVKEQTQEEQTDSWVEIYFTDTGIGMDDKTQESIFEPFFTTKKEDKGTGLGLFITYQIIENHGGIIDVESEINKGTTFTIKLKLIK
jgi:signal transduction histidine kinase